MADRAHWKAGDQCSVARSLEIVGTRSALLIMREAFYGTTRFDDFAVRVGMTEAVAAARLKELVSAGLLTRVPYQEPGQRTRFEYRLTEMGADLLPAVLALLQWGDKYLSDAGGPVAVTHAEDGEPIQVEVRCAQGHQLKLGDLAARFRRATPR
jgi:DNA-binding HxlR family transcriptional regulator